MGKSSVLEDVVRRMAGGTATGAAKGKTHVRDKGQVTLPAEVRRAAHLEAGDPVEVEMVAEGILLRPQKVIDATQAWFWTTAWQAGEAEASADIAAGRVTHFDSAEDFLASLDD